MGGVSNYHSACAHDEVIGVHNYELAFQRPLGSLGSVASLFDTLRIVVGRKA
jgi:hypothetical protein